MAGATREPDQDYRPERMTRREVLRRVAGLGAVAGAGAYLAYAPAHYPLSLRDDTGLRGLPVPEVFRLPDFRVAPPRTNGVAFGIGREGGPAVQLAKALSPLGGIEGFVAPGDVVLVKPNVAFDRSPNLGATTSPAVLEALVRMLLVDARASEVRVTDNPIESPADCFAKTGIRAAAERAGARVYLPDSSSFEMLHTPGAVLIREWPFLRRPFRGVTKVIGVSPVKDHNLCHASMGVKNWYGLLGGRRNQFHQDIHEIVSDLAIMIRPTLTILDGTNVLMQSGPTGGDPSYVRNRGVILAGVDAIAMDAWAFEHLLERTGDLPEYLHRAERKGAGSVHYRGRAEEAA